MGPIWGRQDPGGPYVLSANTCVWFSLRQHSQYSECLLYSCGGPREKCIWWPSREELHLKLQKQFESMSMKLRTNGILQNSWLYKTSLVICVQYDSKLGEMVKMQKHFRVIFFILPLFTKFKPAISSLNDLKMDCLLCDNPWKPWQVFHIH